MRVACVWKEETDYAREVREWLDEFERTTGKIVESVDPDTIEGEIFTKARDIVEYPTVVAMNDMGSVLQMWRGTPLPAPDEVSYYAQEM